MPIRILLVEDQPIVRVALHSITDGRADMQIIADTGRGVEAVELHRQHQPDVTIMDLRLPGMSGFEAIAEIRKSCLGARILVLSNYDRSEDIHRALQAGALAYLTKDAGKEELIQAILTVHQGKRYLPASLGPILAERFSGPDLTDRELEVLRVMAQGRSNRGIADSLGISENTVRIHVTHVLQKLGAEDRTQAVIIAIQRGIIHVE
ncbi:MAG TPA: response regulator transcription factor [Bryobacteraceae bacterium]|nr:response regulator transcription factor [Bryobacteraceae bacterium]